MLTFQQIIFKLQNYWADKGCTVIQPFDMEVGAGTSHPATCLRALGPEPWFAAYVQPSRRPKDGRYGDNPNRLQHYYQFQVALKPAPANIQDLYLDSLRELGIDPKVHDIRFVEDDWENPTLGAWGLGWEVWLNGMEVTQFTYFQQVGGIDCSPVLGEITYGIERLAMYLQGVEMCTTSFGQKPLMATSSLTATFIIKTKSNNPPTTSNTAMPIGSCANSTTMKNKPNACLQLRTPVLPCLLTSLYSKPAIRSTSWMHAAPFPLPNAQPTSAVFVR